MEKEEAEEINEDYRKFRKELTLFSSLFIALISNVIPILGPSTVAFIFGRRKSHWQKYGVKDKYLLTTMTIGETIFLIFVLSIARYEISFWDILPLIIIGFIINVVALTGSFFAGIHTEKTKKFINDEKNSNYRFSSIRRLR